LHKSQLDSAYEYLNKEITALKHSNSFLTEQVSNKSNLLDIAEAEKKKEISLKITIHNELTNSIKLHETEVSLRIKFENKLNNVNACSREIETRFFFVSNELESTLK